jgi:Flp pilus assembly protein protease CpaA
MIFYIRAIVAIVLLTFASKQDMKTREVSDWIWGVMFSLALAFLCYDIFFNNIYKEETFVAEMILMGVMVAFSYVIFKLFNKWQEGSFGGADAKAFACIALLLPSPMLFDMVPFSYFVLVIAELLSLVWYLPKAVKLPKDQWSSIKYPLMPFILAGVVFTIWVTVVEELI